jgi:hypothetical protein
MHGISTATIHAPRVNFVTPMITATTPVTAAPVPFSRARSGHFGPWCRNQ